MKEKPMVKDTPEEQEKFETRYKTKMESIIKESSLLELNRHIYARYRYVYSRIRNPKEHAIPLYTS